MTTRLAQFIRDLVVSRNYQRYQSLSTRGVIRARQTDRHLGTQWFPKDPDIKDKWIFATGKTNWFPTKYSRICSVHFTNEQFNSSTKRRTLIKSAVPTVDIWRLITATDNLQPTLTPSTSKCEFPEIVDAIHEVTIKPDPDALEQEDHNNSGGEDTDMNSSSMFGGKTDTNDIVPILREMSSYLQKMANKQEDSFESFGKYVAATLRNMPERNSMELQLQIVNLLIADQYKNKPPTNYAGEKS
ncbi:unnamed protein product, partial [Brenthis ino]